MHSLVRKIHEKLEIANEATNIDVKNPGILEVPQGKNVEDLPQSHFNKLVDKIGYDKVVRALTNLEVWNKNKNKSLSKWASGMAGKLKKKFRAESIQNEAENNKVIRRGKTINGNPWTETKIDEKTVNILGIDLHYEITKFHVDMPDEEKTFTDRDRIESHLINKEAVKEIETIIKEKIYNKLGNKVILGSSYNIGIPDSCYIKA